jgi:hypothetical protein
MMSDLSQKIYVLIVRVCRNGSNEWSCWPVNEDKHKGDTDSQTTKEIKFIVAQILYMQDRRPHALETPVLANSPLSSHSYFAVVKSTFRLHLLLSSQSSNGRQMVIGNGH